MNFSYVKCNSIRCCHNTCCTHHCTACGHTHTHTHTHHTPYVHKVTRPFQAPVTYTPISSKLISDKRVSNTPVTTNNFFKIVIVLDESGSMESIKDSMRKSINELIMEQKQVEGRQATFTLVKFNNKVNRVVENLHLNEVRDVRENEYRPSGTTALYDAIGDTIDWFRNEKDVLMVIVTDGAENSSKSYKKQDITRMVDDKEKNNNWSYVYLSCDLNTFAQGNNIGLNKSKYASNCIVEQQNYGNFVSQNLNSAISNYRSKGISVQEQLNAPQ